VTSVDTPDPYTVGKVTKTHHGSGKQIPVQFPVTLHKGDALHAQVKFAPAAPGGTSGQLTFATTGSAGSVAVPLIGDGTQTGLFATVPAMSFVLIEHDGTVITNVPVGVIDPQQTTIVNGGDTPVTVTSVTPPAGPYTALNLPKAGTVIKPGESIPVEVTFAPQRAVTSNSSFTVTASTGTSATVTLTGTGLPPVTKFTASPSTVSFGPVRVGHTATVLVHVVNAGNQPSLMRRTPPPGGPFGAPLRVTNGLPVNGGYDLELPVTFHPTKAGTFTGVYKLRWTDRLGAHTLDVPISGTGVG
jgi:Abnormal spindle-like microcephaly-assoc'd, ASPM-SPD-2-Hydin